MTYHTFCDFKTKKSVKEAVAKGDHVLVIHKTPWGDEGVESGRVFLSGPHACHKWYAEGWVENGKLVKIK